MNNHLTDRQLLDAQFRLCTDEQSAAIAEHLAECADCRNRADALRQKFASLDLLRGDVSTSEQLIAETLRQVRNAPERRTMLLPRFGWAAAFAAAAVLLALLYTGPFAGKRPMQVAMSVEVTAPSSQVEAPHEEMKNATTPPVDEIADYAAAAGKDQREAPATEPVELKGDRAESVLAMAESKPAFRRPFALGESAVAMKASRGHFAAPAAVPPARGNEWSVSAPPDVTVSVNPSLVDGDEALRKLKKEDHRTARQYAVHVINPSKNAATALVTRTFATTNWTVSVPGSMARVSTQDAHVVELSIEAPAESERAFPCTVITPAKPTQGVVP